jgi:sugar phosphate permease
MIAVAFPASYFVREPPVAARTVSDVPKLGSILSGVPFYLLMIGSMASIGAVGGTMQNLALYLSLDRQFPQVTIDSTLSLILIGSLVGRLLMGWLADRWPKQRVMLLIYVIVAATIPPLFYAPTPATLSVCAFLFGVGLGGDYMIIPLMAAEMYGLAVMGRVMGVVLTADGVAEALVPMIVAGVRDRTGSYAGGFVVLVTLAAIGAAAVALLGTRVKRARPAATSV